MTVSNNRIDRGRSLGAARKLATTVSSKQLERRLGELVTRAAQARVALRRGGLEPALRDRCHEELRQAVVELVGNYDVMVGDLTARLVSLRGMIQTLRKNY